MDIEENLENIKKVESKGIKVKAIPDEYPGATPYLYVNMASAALEFYQKAFGAKVLMSLRDDKNRIVHSEIEISKARIMISDEFPEKDNYSPRHLGGTTSAITLYVEDSDKIFKQAIAAGAQELAKVEDYFWGDRGGKIVDPFGHHWFIYSRKENIPYEERKKRGEESFRKH